jgi:hypothetical protein
MPPNMMARPKNRIVKSSSSLVRNIRDTKRPPHRATVNMTIRKRKAIPSLPTTGQISVSPESTTDTIAR